MQARVNYRIELKVLHTQVQNYPSSNLNRHMQLTHTHTHTRKMKESLFKAVLRFLVVCSSSVGLLQMRCLHRKFKLKIDHIKKPLLKPKATGFRNVPVNNL